MSRLLTCRAAAAGEEAVLLQLPADMRHVASVAVQGAAATAFLAAASAATPVVAARCSAALHSSADDRYQLVSSVVQLLLDTAQGARRQNAKMLSGGSGDTAKHEPGRWPAPGAALEVPNKQQALSKRLPCASRGEESTVSIMQLAHAIQAAHAQPPASLIDAVPIATLPRKAGPPRLMHRHKPTKRASSQSLQSAGQLSSSSGGNGDSSGRLYGKRKKNAPPVKPKDPHRRPAWAELMASERSKQEQALLDFVNSL